MHDRHVTLRDGEKVLIRPLLPEDAALYPDFLAEVTAEDLRLRFFAPMRAGQPRTDRQAHPLRPGARHGLHRHRRGRAAGCSAWCGCTTTPTANGEFAILLRSHLKGHGLGWLMMKHMIAYAKEKGLKSVRGQVLAENASMLRCARSSASRSPTISASAASSTWTLPLDEVPAEALH